MSRLFTAKGEPLQTHMERGVEIIENFALVFIAIPFALVSFPFWGSVWLIGFIAHKIEGKNL